MTKITDPKLIKDLEKKSGNELPETLNKVKDPDLVNALDQKFEQGSPSYLNKAYTAISDFFSGTKKTEYAELPEIGSYKGEGEFKIALGLNITPDMKAQAEIIQAQVPGAKIFKDKFNNPIVTMPDGKSFYLNKPGASPQDFIQTTSQILQYIPGQSYVAKKLGQSYLKRTIASGAAGGSTSIAQDLAAMSLGAENINATKAAISTATPIVFEGAINPLVGLTFRKLFGNPKYTEIVEGKIQLNKKGKKAAEAAGLDVDNLSESYIQQFAKELSSGVDETLASVQAGAGQFGFRLSVGQASQNAESIAILHEAKKGAFGRKAQEEAIDFFTKQGIDVETSAKSLMSQFNRGQLDEMTLNDAGEQIVKGLNTIYKKKSEDITTAYNAIDKDAVFNGQESNVKNLTKSIEDVFSSGKFLLDTDLTPASIKANKVVNDFVTKISNSKKAKVNDLTINNFEVVRRKLSNLIGSASTKTDRASSIAIKKEFDKFYDDALDNALFGSGDDPSIINSLKNARYLFQRREKLFGDQTFVKDGFTIKDRTTKIINTILHDADVTPDKTIDYIFGSGVLGLKDTSLSVVKRLKTIFAIDKGNLGQQAAKSKDFQALRTAAFNKIIRDSIKNGQFVAKKFHDQYKNIMNKNSAIMKELFDQNELNLIDDFTDEVAKTFKNTDLVNFSNTASGLNRLMQQFGRGLIGIVGFKLANIQGLLAARGLFDRTRDVYHQKTAQKLLETELRPAFYQIPYPKATATETAIINEPLGGMSFEAAKPPQGLIPNN